MAHTVIDCVAIFYEEGKGGENFCKKKFRCRIDKEETGLVKSRASIWQVVSLKLEINRPWKSWNSNMEESIRARRTEFPFHGVTMCLC